MQMADYDRFPRLPDSPPRVRAFLNKKQQSEQETTTAAHCWVHFWARFLESVISESFFQFFLQLLKQIVETKAQTWWSDTPWAKARQIQ